MRTYRAELLRAAGRGNALFLLFCFGLQVFAMSNAGPQHQTPLWGFRQASILVATLLMGRAATVTAGEYGSGTIRAWLISSPARGPVVVQKLAASLSIALAFVVVAGIVGYGYSCLLGTVTPVRDAASSAAELAAASFVLTLLGHAAGVVTRSVPVALTVTLGWLLAAENLLNGPLKQADRWLPGLIANEMTQGRLPAGLTWPVALTHAVLPFLVLDVVAMVCFARRDITA